MAVLTQDIAGTRKVRILYGLTGCHLVNDFYSMIFPVFLYSLIRAFGLSNLEAGIVTFTTVLASAVFQPVIGYYSDLHRKRKFSLAFGLLLAGASMAILGLANSYWTLIAAAVLLGLGGSAYHPQSTNLLAYFFPQSRGRASGIHGIGNALGFVTVFLAGGLFIGALGWRQAAYLMIIPGILASLFAWAAFEEPTTVGGKGIIKGITKPLVVLTLANGFNMMVFMGFITFIPVFYATKGGFPVPLANTLVAVMLLPVLLAQPLGGALSDKLGRRNVILLSLIMVSLFVVSFSLYSGIIVWSLPGIVLLTFLASAIFSFLLFMSPVALMFASELAVGERRGTTVGVVWGMSIAMGSLTPPLVGYLIDSFGFSLAFLSLLVLAVGGVLLTLALPRRGPASAPTAQPASAE
jgi:FSR family fosmidomycin resistance protein-like MFS transporter